MMGNSQRMKPQRGSAREVLALLDAIATGRLIDADHPVREQRIKQQSALALLEVVRCRLRDMTMRASKPETRQGEP